MHYRSYSALFSVFYHISCTIRFIRRCGMVCAGEGQVRRRISGVSISGIPWKVGQHCLYDHGPGSATRVDSVTNMFRGMTDMMDEFIIFQLENKPITSRRVHYCLLSNDGYTTEYVLWNQVTWKCKVLSLGDDSLMALPFASCTPQELVEFKWNSSLNVQHLVHSTLSVTSCVECTTCWMVHYICTILYYQ